MLQGIRADEKLLILNNVRQRIHKEMQDLRVADTMNQNPMMRWANKFVSKHGKELE